MLYSHYSQVPWDKDRWPNFSPNEPNLFCPCCGEFYLDERSLDALQFVRTEVGRAIKINSGHRCFLRNYLVGGKPLSQHKKVAFDINTYKHDVEKLLLAARRAGFRGFGFYSTFLHVDMGRARFWATKGGRKKWNGLI